LKQAWSQSLNSSSVRSSWVIAVALTLFWGAAAFGSNYPWAYRPLLVSSALLGIVGILLGEARPRAWWTIVAALGLVTLAVVIQLVPLPHSRLTVLSPNAEQILRQQDLAYAHGFSPNHPLTLDPQRTWLGLTFLVGFSLLLVGTMSALNRDSARRLCAGIVMLGTVLAAIGIVQRATYNGRIYGFWQPYHVAVPFGPFVNPNHFAGWMLMALPVAIGVFIAAVSRGMGLVKPGIRNRILWFSTPTASRTTLTGFAILVMALSLVLTLSRSGILAFVAALVIMATFVVRRQMGASKRAITGVYLLSLPLAVLSFVGIDRIVARFADPSALDGSGRLAIWQNTWLVVRDFWLTGTGLNTYGVSMLHYQTAAAGHHLREAHSDYLQIAAEGGLLLGVPVLVVTVVFAAVAYRRLKADEGSTWWLRAGAVTGLVAIALQSIGEFSLQMPGNAALFAVLVGLALHHPAGTVNKGAGDVRALMNRDS